MKGTYTFLENMAISEVKELYAPSLKLGSHRDIWY